jgi:hypothetical protein
MPSPDKRAPSLKARLKKLDKLARETAKLAVEIFGELVTGNSNPVPPKPKKPAGMIVMASSNPVPPKPKLETLALIADGAMAIGQGLEDLESEQSEE